MSELADINAEFIRSLEVRMGRQLDLSQGSNISALIEAISQQLQTLHYRISQLERRLEHIQPPRQTMDIEEFKRRFYYDPSTGQEHSMPIAGPIDEKPKEEPPHPAQNSSFVLKI